MLPLSLVNRGRFARWMPVGLVLLHIWLCSLRLNNCAELDPDSTEYLVGAHAVWLGRGFVDLTHPDEHAIVARQPGTAWLLAPLVGVLGYNVVAIKSILVMIGAAGIWFVMLACSSEDYPFASLSGRLSLFALAASPMACLVHSGLFSETPFLLEVALGWLAFDRFTHQPTRFRAGLWWILAVLLFILAGKTRTMGLAVAPALLLAGAQRPFNIYRFAMAALAATIVASAICFTGTSVGDYLNMFREDRADHPLTETLQAAFWSGVAYLQESAAVVAPGACSSLNTSITLTLVRRTPGAGVLMFFLGLFVWRIAIGEWFFREAPARRTTRAAMGWTSLFMFAMLLVWPRMDRLLHPVFLPLSATFWIAAFRKPNRWAPVLAGLALVGFLDAGWVGWTGKDVAGFRQRGQRAQAVGAVMRQEVPTSETTLVDVSEIFLHSGRRQLLDIEGLADGVGADELLTMMFQRHIGWMALTARSQEPMLHRHIAFRLEPVLRDGKPTQLWRVTPNRDGTVRLSKPIAKDADNTFDELDRLLQQAEDHLANNRLKEAEQAAQNWFRLGDRRRIDWARACFVLGDVRLEQGRIEDANAIYQLAREGPSIDRHREAIDAMTPVLKLFRMLKAPETPPARSAAILELLAQGHELGGKWERARNALREATDRDPTRAAARLRLARVEWVLGDRKQAVEHLEKVLTLAPADGLSDAGRATRESVLDFLIMAGLLAVAERMENRRPAEPIPVAGQNLDATHPQTWRDGAARADRLGFPGVGLRFLEIAIEKEPASLPLIEAYIERLTDFGHIDEAEKKLDALMSRLPQSETDRLRRRIREKAAMAPAFPDRKLST